VKLGIELTSNSLSNFEQLLDASGFGSTQSMQNSSLRTLETISLWSQYRPKVATEHIDCLLMRHLLSRSSFFDTPPGSPGRFSPITVTCSTPPTQSLSDVLDIRKQWQAPGSDSRMAQDRAKASSSNSHQLSSRKPAMLPLNPMPASGPYQSRAVKAAFGAA
tara:strand:+ start:11829 stop:12314 length:486 start_codon:yes stop_codon:yes gene_type:complete